jgi:putative transposase
MPSHLERRYGTHHLHFITCSCYRRIPLLNDDRIKQTFLEVLEDARQKYGFCVHGYVIMPEHFHLLISEPETGDPGTVMQVLKQRVSHQGLKILYPTLSQKTRKDGPPDPTKMIRSSGHPHPTLSQKMGKNGAPKLTTTSSGIQVPNPKTLQFWQTRFYDFNVWSQAKKVEKLKYMHRNPVRRRLVARPEDWPWSSFRHYALGEVGAVEIESEWTALRREREVHVLQLPSQ